MSHFMTVCSGCGVVITQCRCPDPNKTVKYEICDKCKSRPKEATETTAQELVQFYMSEINGVLDIIPKEYRVYVKGSDEHNSLAATLAISVAKLVMKVQQK